MNEDAQVLNEPFVAGFILLWGAWTLAWLWSDHRTARILPYHQFRVIELLSRRYGRTLRFARQQRPLQYELTFWTTLGIGLICVAIGILGAMKLL